MYVFHLPEEYSFEKVGIKGTNFDTKDFNDEAKFAIIEVEEGHSKVREKECTMFYFILEGKGNFEIDGKTEQCQKGDLVIVPRNTVFKYTGKMKMLLVTIPWWYPEQEETLE
jgi:mannose-6-phosphate isomerase-like protein (cupin superfamily)